MDLERVLHRVCRTTTRVVRSNDTEVALRQLIARCWCIPSAHGIRPLEDFGDQALVLVANQVKNAGTRTCILAVWSSSGRRRRKLRVRLVEIEPAAIVGV